MQFFVNNQILFYDLNIQIDNNTIEPNNHRKNYQRKDMKLVTIHVSNDYLYYNV